MPEEEDEAGIKIQETVNSFRRLGFVFPVRVFSAEESVHYRAKYGWRVGGCGNCREIFMTR